MLFFEKDEEEEVELPAAFGWCLFKLKESMTFLRYNDPRQAQQQQQGSDRK